MRPGQCPPRTTAPSTERRVTTGGMADDNAPTDVIARIPSVSLARVRAHVIEGRDRGLEKVLEAGVTQIGTAERCGMRLTDPSVSRVHCEVRVDPDGVSVVDLGSTNGSYVDGVRVRDAIARSGAVIDIGGTKLQLSFEGEPIKLLLPERERFGVVLGASLAMRRVYDMLERIAPTESTVLLRGETGTGKEMVARAIHDASRRARGPFVAVDCGAIADDLIESELFGHVRGAFTGAAGDRRGLFEEADGGTLFLDEIGEMPLQSQPKLLRALETRQVRRVGANATKPIDVRVIAATNRPLGQHVNDGSFRDDLYYRLAVFEIVLPPLRERREDIPLLARHFHDLVTGNAAPPPPEALAALAQRSWPGNVRELKNFVERSACLGWSAAWTNEAPAGSPAPAVEGLVRTDLQLSDARALWSRQFESLYVAALLRQTGGNVTRAAQMAGISRRSFHRILAENKLSSRAIVEDDAGGDD